MSDSQIPTLHDLSLWAGETILARGRKYIQKVRPLSSLADGSLAAWVRGSEPYATRVRVDEDGDIEYECSYPYDRGPCKHAVAVLLAAAQYHEQGRTVPVLDLADPLALALSTPEDSEEEEWEDDEDMETLLADKSRHELLDLLRQLLDRRPELRRELHEMTQWAKGNKQPAVTALRREIQRLTAEPAWYNAWEGQGHVPDFSYLKRQLKALREQGMADAVLGLGELLWERGNAQVEQSDDEGETATAIGACMDQVLAALPQSSMGKPEQLLWAIDHCLEDEYGLIDCEDSWRCDGDYTPDHWRQVANKLRERLDVMAEPRVNNFSDRYRRSGLLRVLLDAYGQAGLNARIIPLLEREADHCECHDLLVDALLAEGRTEQARQRCIQGYRRTVQNTPGLAANLQTRLRDMARDEGRLDRVAAYYADDFLAHPCLNHYQALEKAATQAGCWSATRRLLLAYLHDGTPPRQSPQWPLPEPEVAAPPRGISGRQSFPDLDTLMEIAILERRVDDLPELYEQRRTGQQWMGRLDLSVAEAIEKSHPDLALSIWRACSDRLIARVKPSAYEEAAPHLQRMHRVYRQENRLKEWSALLAGLRAKHKAKRRLMEVLDRLERKVRLQD